MIKLKDILLEYIDKDIALLRDYINSSPAERIEELRDLFSDENILEWFREQYNLGFNVIDEDDWEEITSFEELKERFPKVHKELIDILSNMVSGKLSGFQELVGMFHNFDVPHEDIPTWRYLANARIVSNQWLVHETNEDDAESIFKNGFTRGVFDHTKLGLTTWIDGFLKEGPGYNFAYTLDDFLKYGQDGYRLTYGNVFLVFRASGVRAFHETDEEPQVIFTGKTARDIVPVFRDVNGEWEILSRKAGKPLYVTDDLENITPWIEKNYAQYRKSIGWEKPKEK